jgi:hypothetical protein
MNARATLSDGRTVEEKWRRNGVYTFLDPSVFIVYNVYKYTQIKVYKSKK